MKLNKRGLKLFRQIYRAIKLDLEGHGNSPFRA